MHDSRELYIEGNEEELLRFLLEHFNIQSELIGL